MSSLDQIPPQSLLSDLDQFLLGFLTLHGDEGTKGMKTRRTLGVVDGLEGEREMISLPYGSTLFSCVLLIFGEIPHPRGTQQIFLVELMPGERGSVLLSGGTVILL